MEDVVEVLGDEVTRVELVKVEQVIVTRLTHRGTGIPENPHRTITQVWHMDGRLFFEIDPLAGVPVRIEHE